MAKKIFTLSWFCISAECLKSWSVVSLANSGSTASKHHRASRTLTPVSQKLDSTLKYSVYLNRAPKLLQDKLNISKILFRARFSCSHIRKNNCIKKNITYKKALHPKQHYIQKKDCTKNTLNKKNIASLSDHLARFLSIHQKGCTLQNLEIDLFPPTTDLVKTIFALKL